MENWDGFSDARVKVTVRDCQQLLSDLRSRIETRRGFSIATLNLDHVVKLDQDKSFQAAYAAHSHVTADGWPIVLLSRLAGQRVDLLPGSDLVDPIAKLAEELSVPVALVGATDCTLDGAKDSLKSQYVELNILLTVAPSMSFDPYSEEAKSIIHQLSSKEVGLVFVALGAPKQEQFVSQAQLALPEVGFVSVGAGLDFIAGTRERAPSWLRSIKLEWLWRLMLEPRRLFSRYALCILALPRLTIRSLKARVK